MKPSQTIGALVLVTCATFSCRNGNADVERNRLTPAQRLMAVAIAQLDSERNSEAIASLDSAIALDSTVAAAYKHRGNAYRRIGDIDAAIRNYDRAIALNNRDARFFNDRGFALQRLQKLAEAKRDFDSALVLNPKLGVAHANRGRTHFYLGNFREAERDLQAEYAIDSANIYLAIWLHFIRGRLSRPDTARLAAEMAHLDTIAWPGPVARYFAGHISAKELLRLSAGHDSTTRVDQRCAWFFYRGEYDLMYGRQRDALQNFTQAEAICPKRFSEFAGAVAELRRLRDSVL